MRLFMAITFDDIIKQELVTAIDSLRKHAIKGNFTLKENLHLTLEFIGETNNYAAVRKAVEKISGRKFDLEIGGFGSFDRDGGKVCWIGVEKCEELLELQRNVHLSLLKEGFRLDSRPYKPHLTLGREVVLEPGFALESLNEIFPGLREPVKMISLMKSERMNGKLVYTEIEKIRLTR